MLHDPVYMYVQIVQKSLRDTKFSKPQLHIRCPASSAPLSRCLAASSGFLSGTAREYTGKERFREGLQYFFKGLERLQKGSRVYAEEVQGLAVVLDGEDHSVH